MTCIRPMLWNCYKSGSAVFYSFEVVYVGTCMRVGSGHGLVVRVFYSGRLCRGFDPHPNLPQYTQLQMSTNIVGKVPAMD